MYRKVKHLYHILKRVKMNYLKKVCAHDKVIVALNADNDKYLNYEISINEDLFGSLLAH